MLSKKRTKIVCMGDSITEGYGLGDDISCYYPSKLKELLGDDYLVYNKGASGCCVTNLRLPDGQTIGLPYVKQPRYHEALAIRGDIYIVMIGTNDAQDGLDNEQDIIDPCNEIIKYKGQFKQFLQGIVDDIRKVNPNSLIYLVKPVPVMKCIWRKHQQKYLEQLMPYYDEIVAENENMKLVSMSEIFFEQCKESQDVLYQEDGLHPNAKGAAIIAQTIAKAILED